MEIKKSRLLSFVMVLWVYAIAGAFALLCFSSFTLRIPLYWNVFVCDVIATAIVFLFSVLFENSSVYDPYWSVQPPFILCSFAIANGLNTGRLLVLVAVLVWAIRLTANWAYTFKNLEHQDWRYTQLKNQSGKLYPLVNFFGIHLFPTIVVYACVLPAMFVFNEESSFSGRGQILCIVGCAICILAALLQLVADTQMHAFRKNKETGFIRYGLWKYSRHPNYLGEILMWWGVALAAIGLLGFRWYFIFGAGLNTLMFLFISIPLAENHQASRKPGFAEYKKQTRMLFPLYKRQSSAEER